MLMRSFTWVATFTLLLAATDRAASTRQPAIPLRIGIPDLTIGGEDASGDQYIFQTVSGLAFDANGRLVVTDLKENAIRVYQPSGVFAFQVGRKGAGPGEYVNPIGAAFSADGLLWTQDEANQRFNSYSLGAAAAANKSTMHYDFQRAGYRFQPIAFDGSGRLIALGSFRDEATGERHPGRFTIDRTGRVVRADTIAEPPGDSLSDRAITSKRGEGAGAIVVTSFYSPIYGPAFLFVQSPNGSTARTITSRYDIAWRGPDGKLLRTIRKEVQGPVLSARERKLEQERIDNFVQRAKASTAQVPGVPDRKVPIGRIAFDQLGRLWVERFVADGTPREADLYDASGTQIAVMRWPRDVTILDFGLVAAQATRVLGVGTDSLGTERVVRLTFK